MRVAVIGLGSIGERHLRNLRALGIEDLIGVDPDECARARVRDIARVVPTTEAALASAPEAVCVCTPNHLHASAAIDALRTGAHVFVEKPIAHAEAAGAALAVAAGAAGRIVLVGCNMRFHPGVAALRAALAEGLLPDPCVFRAWFAHYLPNWRPAVDYRRTYSAQASQGGGIVLDAVHELDYLAWLGGGIVSVRAAGLHASDLAIDTEDVATVLVQFRSGRAGLITLDYVRPIKSRGCEIYGPSGVLCWTSEGKAPERITVTWTSACGAAHERLRIDAYDANDMYVREMQHFLACINGRETPLLDAAGGLEVLRHALAAKCDIAGGVTT